jgi:hypothetical protein
MKKTLQECKEIVANERGFNNWNELTLSTCTEYLADLANKMYYEQSEWIRVDELEDKAFDYYNSNEFYKVSDAFHFTNGYKQALQDLLTSPPKQ